MSKLKSNDKMATEKPSVVIDNGSYCCKAGFACDNHPVSIFRTVVGRPKNRQGFYGKGPYEVYIGDEAVSKIEDYELHSPIVRGQIVHWDNMERVWHHIFYRDLKVAPEDRAVLLALAPKTTIKEKVHCCEIFFETLNAPTLSVQAQCNLALYGSGSITGLAVDLGYDMTDVNPVYEGGSMTFAHMESHLSGREISKLIKNSLLSRGIELGSDAHSIVEDIKRNELVVSPTSNELICRHKYTLPSGEIVDISKEIHCATEILFNPGLVTDGKKDYLSLQDAVIIAAKKCDAELHNELFAAVVPTGGMSAFPGLTKRLTRELEISLDRPVNVIESPEMYCLAWLGGAIYAGMKDIKKVWVQKKQFEEYGEKIVRNKFI